MSKRFITITLSLVAFLLIVTGAVYAYDSTRKDVIAKGVKVGGVEVGGLTVKEARTKVRRQLLLPLNGVVVIKHDEQKFHLTARQARVSADLRGMIDEALDRSREGSIFSRTMRDLTGGKLNTRVAARISYSRKAVGAKVTQIKRAIARPAADASLDFSGSGFTRVAEKNGLAVNDKVLRGDVTRELLSLAPNQTVRIHTHKLRPKVRSDDLASTYPRLILVNRSAFELRFYKNLRPAKTYRIAVGRAGLETPEGLYHIQDKQVNPSWHVPNSKWAGKLAGKVIPPGPDDPIKARWMGLFAGAGIHGTTDVGSLGSAASHGCIRMAIPDVIELYSKVETQDPVYIA